MYLAEGVAKQTFENFWDDLRGYERFRGKGFERLKMAFFGKNAASMVIGFMFSFFDAL